MQHAAPVLDPVARSSAALEGRYRIERELGSGGMATVYLATDVPRLVLLKNFSEELRQRVPR